MPDVILACTESTGSDRYRSANEVGEVFWTSLIDRHLNTLTCPTQFMDNVSTCDCDGVFQVGDGGVVVKEHQAHMVCIG